MKSMLSKAFLTHRPVFMASLLLYLTLGSLTAQQPKVKPIIERITLQVKENDSSDKYITRKGILTRYPHAQATVVIAHGFMCNKDDIRFLEQIFNKGRYNTLIFDFRAHGEDSQGQVCSFGKNEALDVTAAAEFVRNHTDLGHLPVFAYGFSMGAASTVIAQAQNNKLFDALILDCPFASTENTVRRALDLIKISLLGYDFPLPAKSVVEKYAYNPYVQSVIKYLLKASDHMGNKNIIIHIEPIEPVEALKKISVPCFFIHCKNDEKISIDDARALYSSAQGFKRLWLTEGRSHYDSFFYNPRKYKKRVRNFLNNILDETFKQQPLELVWEDGKKNKSIQKNSSNNNNQLIKENS